MNDDLSRPLARSSRAASAGLLLLAAASTATLTACSGAPPVTTRATPSTGAPSAKASSASAALAPVFARAELEAQGHLGVAVLHVESGERASFRGDERFPLQSVFKVPLGIEVLAR